MVTLKSGVSLCAHQVVSSVRGFPPPRTHQVSSSSRWIYRLVISTEYWFFSPYHQSPLRQIRLKSRRLFHGAELTMIDQSNGDHQHNGSPWQVIWGGIGVYWWCRKGSSFLDLEIGDPYNGHLWTAASPALTRWRPQLVISDAGEQYPSKPPQLLIFFYALPHQPKLGNKIIALWAGLVHNSMGRTRV